MEKYQLDYERSIQLCNAYYEYSQPKHCIDNVWGLVSNGCIPEDWDIAYGLKKIKGGLFVRHAFLIDTKNNRVIDPTRPYKETMYIVAVKYSIEEYVRLASKYMTVDMDDNPIIRDAVGELIMQIQNDIKIIG